MYEYRYQIVMVVSGILAILLFGVIRMLEKQVRLDQSNSIFVSSRKRVVRYRTTYVWYKRLSNFKLTKRYILRMYEQFSILFPGDEATIQDKTIKVSATLWSVSGIAILVTLLLNPSPYFIACIVIIVYVFNVQLTTYLVRRYHEKILQEFDKFLDGVRYYYMKYNEVSEAVYDAMNEAPDLMKRHAIKIYEVIISDTQEEEIFKYNSVAPNYFFKEFLASCVTTYNYGDTMTEKGSQFLCDIKALKNHLGSDEIVRNNKKMDFAFLPIISVLPIFSLDALKNWSISNFASLESFYEGFVGTALVVASFLVVLFCYATINRLKSESLLDLSNHDFLKWVCRLPLVRNLLENYYTRNYGRRLSTKELLKKTGSKLSPEEFLVKRKRQIFLRIS